MAVTLTELSTSRSFTDSATAATGSRKYLARVTGTATPEADLEAAVAAAAPFFWGGLQRREIKADALTGELYEVEVPYSTEQPNTAAQDPQSGGGAGTGPGGGAASGTPGSPAADTDPVGPHVTLEIAGRPPKVMQSLAVIGSGAVAGAVVPDHGRLVNFDRKDGKVEGVEIDDPASVLTIDVQFDFVSMKFIKLLQSKVWQVNLNDWYHLDAGCVAFMGCTLTGEDNGRVKGSFRFGLRPKETVAIGDIRNDAGGTLPAAAFDRAGWDYLEIQYRDEPAPAGGYLIGKPYAYILHEVLDSFDFTLLGLGG